MGTLDDASPTRLSKQSRDVPLQFQLGDVVTVVFFQASLFEEACHAL